VTDGGLDAVAFYDKPITKFVRILETYLGVAPRGLQSFMMAVPLWLKEKLWIPMEIEASMERCGAKCRRNLFSGASRIPCCKRVLPLPFQSAAILTVDGVGEWGTSSFGRGDGNRMDLTHELRFPTRSDCSTPPSHTSPVSGLIPASTS